MRKIIGFVISICMVVALVGCGSESGYIDTSSEYKESESSSMTETSETPSSQDSQKPSESGTQVPSETETQKPSETETQEPSETETQKPSETETQEPSESETQKPSESETQEPSESETQKPSESETQEPSESETQKPSETETQEPSESETEESSEQYEEYVLSTQTYEYAERVGEKYYLVSVDECYGLVDFNGNEIVPIEYEFYKRVGENELEFQDGGEEFYVENFGWLERRNAYVYSTDTGELLFQYIANTMTYWEEKHREIIVCDGVEHKILFGDPDSDPLGYFQGDPSITKNYQNGLVMEKYLVFDCADIYEYGAEPREYVSFTDAKTGKLIYEGYTTICAYEIYVEGEDGEWYETREIEPEVVQLSSNISEAKAVVLEYSIQEDKYYLVVVGLDGYVKQEVKDISIFDSSISYSNDWIKMPWTAKMINTKTMEIIDMSIEEETTERWYFGIGEYYAITEFGDDTIYTIYKGATAIGTGYKSLYFSKYYILGKREDGKFAFIDYDGKEQLLVDDYGSLLNDRYLVNDGVGVYYVDRTLKRVSDYIYKGDVENCHCGAIMVDGKYYLIAKK